MFQKPLFLAFVLTVTALFIQLIIEIPLGERIN
jgi:hypothetical protein